MSDGPVVATEKAIYSRLYNDTAGVIAQLGGYPIYNTAAAQTHPDDYVIFAMSNDDDDEEITVQEARSRNFLYEFKCVSYSKTTASTVADLMDTLFHFQFLTISGWNNIWIARETGINFTEIDEASRIIYHNGFLLRIKIEEQI